MGSLLAVIGQIPSSDREERLRRMAARSPYRGTLRSVSHGELSLAVQARGDESSLYQDDRFIIAVHGRVYADCSDTSGTAEISAARLIARLWAYAEYGCLSQIDGEFSLLVHDLPAATTYVCTSLSMTRPLFWTESRDVLVIGTEIRQVAAGARSEQRLDLERIVEFLCFGTPVLDTERTQYVDIHRFVAPNLYEIRPGSAHPRALRSYWIPPQTVALTPSERQTLPATLAQTLGSILQRMPGDSALSLSGGYDSGTLWAISRQELAREQQPKGYALTFAGNDADESKVIRALLDQTNSEAELIESGRFKPSDFIYEHVANVDRIPGAGTLYDLDILGRRMRGDGIACHITGIGAEVWLEAGAAYGADLLRSGHWFQLLGDAMHFQHYIPQELGLVGRSRRFMISALAPRGGIIWRLRTTRPPIWLATQWKDLYCEGHLALGRIASQDGFGRGAKWFALRHYVPGTGVESIEQMCERYGQELACPYLHRRVAELGFRVPARELCGGRHPKHLLRLCATQMLGAQPPWQTRKIIHNARVETDYPLILDLGPAQRWRLVDAGITAPNEANYIWRHASNENRIEAVWSRLAYVERFLRYYDY